MQYPTKFPARINFLVELTIFATIAAGFHIIESYVNPTFFRIGLGNAVILFLIRMKNLKLATATLGLKVFFGSGVTGTLFSPIFIAILIASASSFGIMFMFNRIPKLGPVAISIAGSCSHNLVILGFANIWLNNIFSMLWPYFILFSIFSGSLTGLIVFYLEKYFKPIFLKHLDRV